MSQEFKSIVLIHGLGMTSLSWENWIRRDPSAVATFGINEIVAHYEKTIRALDGAPSSATPSGA